MNWVGGIRNRIKLKQEKKLQKEFFERKRLEKKLNIPNATSVNTTSSNTNGQMKISQDILALQVITKTHDKPVNKRKHEIRQPTRIDFDRRSHSKKYKQEEMIDLPLPSSLKPSKLEFTGAMDLAEIVKPQMFPGNQDSRTEYTESEVNSFEFKNNFENITRYRQHSSYGVQESENISHLHQDVSSRGSIFQKNNDAVFEKRQIQQTYQAEESPFIPFAAPAPHSLATRTTSFINTSQYSKNDFSSPGKSHSPIHTTPPLKTWTQQHDMDAMINIEDINQARKIEKCTTNKRTEPEGEGIFFQKRIYRKNEHDNNIIKNCQDTSMQSPAQNEVTIDCLNKSDPQSFLTDLRLLDELIAESQRTITNPSSDISLTDAGDTNPSRQQDNDNQPECNDAALIHAQCKHQCKTDEKSSTDEVWRNFVMNTRQQNICKKQLQIYEQKRPSSREDTILENLSYNTTGNSQTSRSKAAEELKEVMAVKQYESSQESSYDSSWSSTGSEKYYNRTIRTTASTNKSPIKKVKETTTSETKKPSSSQDLPSSATSEQLANSQTQVYTLGFSHGLQKRHKELPPRSQDPERSNLSSFRIYPLSRSQDRSTQTDHNKTEVPLVCHKYVQCQIQENKIQERSTEICGHEQSETTINGTAITNNDPTSTAVRTDQDYSVEQGQPFVKTSSEIDHTKYPVHLNASVSSKTLVSDLLSKTSTTTNYNELAPVTSNGTTDATFNSSSVTIVELSSVTTPKTSDQPLSTNHIQVTTPHHSSVTTHKTRDQSLSTNTFHVITPDHPSVTIPKTSDQPSATEIVPVTTPNKASMTIPKTSDQPSSTEIVPVTIPNRSSVTTPKTSDQPSTEIVPVTTPNKSSMTTPKTSDQPSSTKIVPATTPNKSSMTIPKTSDQPSSTEILPVTTPDNSSITTPKTRKQPSPAKTFPLTTACVNPSVTTPNHLPGGSSHQLAETTQNDPKSTNSDQLRQTAPKAAPETSIVITTSSNPVNTLISTSEYSLKTFQTTTSASFPPTKLNEASAGSSCGLKEANPPSGNQAIKPIDCNETAAEVQQEENYQNMIKKLEKDIEQLQNINVYQSIVIKFLQM